MYWIHQIFKEKDVNLTSQQWNDIIFEGKNKDYGAYEMRQSSSKRHVIALLSILFIVIFVAVLPVLADKVAERLRPPYNPDDDVVIGKYDGADEIDKLDEMVKETTPPEPPTLTTIQFTAPDIVSEDELNKDQQIQSQEDLSKKEGQISLMTHEGDNNPDAVDLGLLLKHQQITDDAKEKPVEMTDVEILPSYPGGEDELHKFLTDNLIYPRMAKELGQEGRVMVSFVVNKSGAITEIAIQKSPYTLLSNEAVRVVKIMPKWIPGKQNGRTVSVRFLLPIEFKLN